MNKIEKTKTQIHAEAWLHCINWGETAFNKWNTPEGKTLLQKIAEGKLKVYNDGCEDYRHDLALNLDPSHYTLEKETVEVEIDGVKYEVDLDKAIKAGYLKKI